MVDQKLSLNELANLYDGTKIDMEVAENNVNGAYDLVKDEITDFIAISSNKPKIKTESFYESLPNTDLKKSIEKILKNKNLKEDLMKRSAQSDFDSKMARIKKIKSKSYRRMRRREKIKQSELLEDAADSESEQCESDVSSEDIKDFDPILKFKKNSENIAEVEDDASNNKNDLFEVPGFKGNEIDFLKEKKTIIFEDAPQVIEHSLPGWNSWAGDGIEFKKTKLNTIIEKKEGIAASNRQDFKKQNIIINEHIEVNDKYKAKRPYGYTGKDFIDKINTPISLETTSLKIFNRFVKMNNKEENVPGKDIQPKEFDPQY
jgi:U3 small nucleolar RNA-associated protein 14